MANLPRKPIRAGHLRASEPGPLASTCRKKCGFAGNLDR